MFKVGSPRTAVVGVAIHRQYELAVRQEVYSDRASLDHPNECPGYCDTVGLSMLIRVQGHRSVAYVRSKDSMVRLWLVRRTLD